MKSFQRILFPTDFSPLAGHAFGYALGTAREFGARLFILHVINEQADLRGFYLPHLAYEEVEADIEEAAKRMLEEFRAGRIQMLVATTVIEVGVDVPNATVMVIEHAERFGLAQLHQLRGRIGRGREKSYCILVAPRDLPGEGRERLETLVRTANGAEIAEADLKLRGPGEFFGTAQHGAPALRVASLLRDHDLLEMARQEAFALAGDDARAPELERMLTSLDPNWQRRYELARVG